MPRFSHSVVSIWVSVKIGWVEFELNNKFTVDATKTSFITLTLIPISNITSSQQALISLKYCTGPLAKLFRFTTGLLNCDPLVFKSPRLLRPLLLRCFTSCSPGKMNRNWKRTLNCQNNVCHENYNDRQLFGATRSSHFINMYWTKRISLIFVTWALFEEYNY
jgi:hypothetical protein